MRRAAPISPTLGAVVSTLSPRAPFPLPQPLTPPSPSRATAPTTPSSAPASSATATTVSSPPRRRRPRSRPHAPPAQRAHTRTPRSSRSRRCSPAPGPPAGFWNIARSCHLGATLAALAALPSLQEWARARAATSPVAAALRASAAGAPAPLDPRPAAREIAYAAGSGGRVSAGDDIWDAAKPQDAHETLARLLQALIAAERGEQAERRPSVGGGVSEMARGKGMRWGVTAAAAAAAVDSTGGLVNTNGSAHLSSAAEAQRARVGLASLLGEVGRIARAGSSNVADDITLVSGGGPEYDLSSPGSSRDAPPGFAQHSPVVPPLPSPPPLYGWTGVVRTCSVCNWSSDAVLHVFSMLSLPLPTRRRSLARALLDSFATVETGIEARCERCDVVQPHVRRHSIARFPSVLGVHLQKAYLGGGGTADSDIRAATHPTVFPELLTLPRGSPVPVSSVETFGPSHTNSWPGKPHHPQQTEVRDSVVHYRLRSVVQHYGGSGASAHFVAVVARADEPTEVDGDPSDPDTDQHLDSSASHPIDRSSWWLVDDGKVRKCATDVALNPHAAYLLFYEKVEDDELENHGSRF